MNTLDFDFTLKALNGQNDKSQAKASHVLANAMGYAQDNKMKFYDWAVKLYEDGKLQVDNADKKLLRDFIEQDRQLPAIIAGQLFKIIDHVGKDS